jgi:MSHA biogenesis protein MshN
MLMERGDLAGAIGVLTTAPPPLETHPGHHALLAALLQRAGNHDAAITAYTELIAVNDRQGLWWMGLAISLEAVARPAAALQAYRQAMGDPRLSTQVARFVRERADALSLAAGEAP